MMTVRELYADFDKRYPRELACDWDHDGLMVCPDPDAEVQGVLCTLDVTDAAVEHAVRAGYNVILAHHPLLFRPLYEVAPSGIIARRVVKLFRHGISVMCFHTRCDAAPGGVSDCMAERMGLRRIATPEGEPLLRVGDLAEAMDPAALAEYVKRAFHVPFVVLADAGKPVARLAVCGGEGGSLIAAAQAAGADAFLSGRLGYHTGVDIREGGLTLIEAGHWYTEQPIAERFCGIVKDTFYIPCAVHTTPSLTVV